MPAAAEEFVVTMASILALTESMSSPTPAAAIIWGLKGLEAELAMLPFLECCMPCTMEVCRWCP